MKQPDAAAYVAEVLAMNPLVDPAAILARRAAFLGLRTGPKQRPKIDPARLQKLRDHAAAKIESLRADFWTMPLEHLQEELRALDVRNLPEFQPTVDRLNQIVKHRPAFAQLAALPQMDRSLFNALRRVLVMPPREAAVVKERFLLWAAGSPTLPACQRMAVAIQQSFPQLYQIEADWLGRVQRLRPRKHREPEPAAATGGGGGFELPVPLWLIVLFALFVLRLMLIALR